MEKQFKQIFVTGGAGYVGARLIPRLLDEGYKVKVLDLYIYGDDVLDQHENLTQIKGDIRDKALLEREVPGCDAFIHLACISNDPSFELNPGLGKSINFDAFRPMVEVAKASGVRRFIYASSSSVYGIKADKNVTEDLPLEPLTDYSKFKAQCEDILLEYQSDDFVPVVIRPATVCGYSRRQRLDVIVNIMANHAIANRKIKVFGGEQLRPNIHIEDMVEVYLRTLSAPDHKVSGKRFNAGYENHSVAEIANMVKKVVGDDISIETTPTDDNRSYHISSGLIKSELSFEPAHTIEDAVRDLHRAFEEGKLPDSMGDSRYFNIKQMQKIELS